MFGESELIGILRSELISYFPYQLADEEINKKQSFLYWESELIGI